MSDRFPWLAEVIGKPWAFAATGPVAFDCWGLCIWVYAHAVGVRLPEFPAVMPKDVRTASRELEAASQSKDWLRLRQPEDFAVVAMSQARAFHHVGIWLPEDNGVVLHAMERSRVVCQSLSSLRRSGMNRIEFYRYTGCPR